MGSGGECINLIRFHICPPLHILLKHVYTSKISYLRTYTPTHSILAYSHLKIFENDWFAVVNVPISIKKWPFSKNSLKIYLGCKCRKCIFRPVAGEFGTGPKLSNTRWRYFRDIFGVFHRKLNSSSQVKKIMYNNVTKNVTVTTELNLDMSRDTYRGSMT